MHFDFGARDKGRLMALTRQHGAGRWVAEQEAEAKVEAALMPDDEVDALADLAEQLAELDHLG